MSEIPEGCTPADAQMLREENHRLAQESHERAMLLIEWLDTSLDAQDEEFEPWIESFTIRTKIAVAAYLDSLADQDKEMAEGFGATLAMTEEAVSETCKWSQDEDGNWFTGCDNAYIISEGTPSENKMAWCCYCGKPLEEVLFKEGEE